MSDKKKTELPKFDGTAVEEIPAVELDDIAGGGDPNTFSCGDSGCPATGATRTRTEV